MPGPRHLADPRTGFQHGFGTVLEEKYPSCDSQEPWQDTVCSVRVHEGPWQKVLPKLSENSYDLIFYDPLNISPRSPRTGCPVVFLMISTWPVLSDTLANSSSMNLGASQFVSLKHSSMELRSPKGVFISVLFRFHVFNSSQFWTVLDVLDESCPDCSSSI